MTCESVVDLKNDVFAVADDRHAVITLPGQFPDQRPFLRRDVRDFVGRAENSRMRRWGMQNGLHGN